MKHSEELSGRGVDLKILQTCILTELECAGCDNDMAARDLVRLAIKIGMPVFAERLKTRLIVMGVDIIKLEYDVKNYEFYEK